MQDLWSLCTHEISEEISCLSTHETTGVGKPRNIQDVGLEKGRIRLENYVDEGGKKFVGTGGGILGDFERLKDALTAADDAF